VTLADVGAVLALHLLFGLVLCGGFRYLLRTDAREVQRNREDACGLHAWAAVAGGGLRCGRCGMQPGLGAPAEREER
jgi:hypothetical protein